MITLKESKNINLDHFSKRLSHINIDKLQIFSINNSNMNTITKIGVEGYNILYIDVSSEQFIKFLNSDRYFLDYNGDSLYILRGGNFLDIKNLFAFIENNPVNIGRGGSQKSHILSPLDFRLSSYIMALFAFDYKLISSLNSFNIISKDRYLSYTNKYSNKSDTIDNKYFKPYKSVILNNYSNIVFKPIIVDKLYCQKDDLGQYFLECADTTCSFSLYDYLK